MSIIATGQLLSVKKNGYWLGLNSLAKDKGYQWSDNSTVTYTNWISGQPDSYNNIEECAEMRSNQGWSDINCYLNRGWMCKIAKGVIPPSNPIVVPETFQGE